MNNQNFVYVVCGGCIDDFHIIAIYKSLSDAQERAKAENEKEKYLSAYVEQYQLL